MSERAERALSEFGKNYNCAQAVVLAFPEITGSGSDNAIKLATGFGGGMGRLQKTCGAVTGAFMVLGMKYGSSEPGSTESKNHISSVIQHFNTLFTDRFGSTDCRDLLGYDLNTEEGKSKISELKLSEKICQKCIAESVTNIEKILKVNG